MYSFCQTLWSWNSPILSWLNVIGSFSLLDNTLLCKHAASILIMIFLIKAESLNSYIVYLFYFPLICSTFYVLFKKSSPTPRSWSYSSTFSFNNFAVLPFKFRLVTYLKLNLGVIVWGKNQDIVFFRLNSQSNQCHLLKRPFFPHCTEWPFVINQVICICGFCF